MSLGWPSCPFDWTMRDVPCHCCPSDFIQNCSFTHYLGQYKS